ncbi:MAG: hypothetical protein IKK34_02170 [Clostridia bacterium]|nr:hypothetical protein [Clostridia bacterium]
MKRILTIALLLLALPCIALAKQAQQDFDAYSRPIDVPGVGPVQYYAQTDPLWENMYYEPNPTKTRRRFRDGGCGPTTAAMAIAKQLSPDDLPALLAHAKGSVKDYAFCSCSVNGDFCDERYRRTRYGTSDPRHREYSPASGEEFFQWLPVVFASYATGNNDHTYQLRLKDEDGTKIFLFNALADDYGLDYLGAKDWDTALAALRAGASVITTVKKGIFTDTSHYLFLAGADDEYLYIMDSDMRAQYRRDKNGYIEILEPGFFRVRLENVPNIHIYSFYIISRAQESTPGEGGA